DDLGQASAGLLVGPGDRACGNQVARLERRTVRGLMRDHLRESPVELGEVAADDPPGRAAVIGKVRRQFDVDPAEAAVVGIEKVGGYVGLVRVPPARRDTERGESFHGHDPRADGGEEALAEMRSENGLEELDAASRPVVDQTAAEQQLLGLSDRDRTAEFVPAAQPGAELQLEVEERLRPETHVVAARRRFVLPARAYDRGAAGADRTRAAVVGHWQRERGQ